MILDNDKHIRIQNHPKRHETLFHQHIIMFLMLPNIKMYNYNILTTFVRCTELTITEMIIFCYGNENYGDEMFGLFYFSSAQL